MRILYAEDEKQMSSAVCAVLRNNNFLVDAVFDGEDALAYASLVEYDAIILDIMMPKVDGLNVLKKLRENGNATPVILLTAKSEIDDRIIGLDAGADDYLAKPFAIGELMARLRALMRRQPEYQSNVLKIDDLSLDRSSYELSGPESSVRLGSKEFQIMDLLMSSTGSPISPDTMLDRIWDVDSEASTNVVWVYVSNLRKRLNQVGSSLKISSMRGLGYFLEKTND